MLVVAPTCTKQSRFIVLLIITLWSLFFIVEVGADSNNLVAAREEALSLGQFSSQDNNSHYIITAPHGGYDLMTEVIVRKVCDNILSVSYTHLTLPTKA